MRPIVIPHFFHYLIWLWSIFERGCYWHTKYLLLAPPPLGNFLFLFLLFLKLLSYLPLSSFPFSSISSLLITFVSPLKLELALLSLGTWGHNLYFWWVWLSYCLFHSDKFIKNLFPLCSITQCKLKTSLLFVNEIVQIGNKFSFFRYPCTNENLFSFCSIMQWKQVSNLYYLIYKT